MVGNWCTGGKHCRILTIGKSGTFLLVATNGGYHRIQHARKVQKYPSTEFLTIVVMCEQVVKRGGILKIGKLGTFLLMEP